MQYPSGIERIAYERQRPIHEEGWTAEHDDRYQCGELAKAAMAYADPCSPKVIGIPSDLWPWKVEWWKPTSKIRDLVKAGALIAAEIDRLQRLEKKDRGIS